MGQTVDPRQQGTREWSVAATGAAPERERGRQGGGLITEGTQRYKVRWTLDHDFSHPTDHSLPDFPSHLSSLLTLSRFNF